VVVSIASWRLRRADDDHRRVLASGQLMQGDRDVARETMLRRGSWIKRIGLAADQERREGVWRPMRRLRWRWSGIGW
jgi:hypothetical protein